MVGIKNFVKIGRFELEEPVKLPKIFTHLSLLYVQEVQFLLTDPDPIVPRKSYLSNKLEEIVKLYD